VKMPPFDYHRPDTVDEAVALLGTYGGDGKVLAGGQSLLPVLALRLTHLGHLIDIGQVQGLQSIEVDYDGILRCGMFRGPPRPQDCPNSPFSARRWNSSGLTPSL